MAENDMIFLVEGRPVGKGRPRFSTIGGHPVAYTPKETKAYEAKVRTAYLERGGKYLDTPVRVTVTAVFAVPKRVSKRDAQDMLDGLILPEIKPDADNIIKVVLDALNGTAYRDDKSVVEARVIKIYGAEDTVLIKIERINCRRKKK